MKMVYEIVRIEKDKIFIVPNLSEKTIIESSATLNSFYKHVSKNWGRNLHVIFGFREGLKYEWKVVRSKKAGAFWGIEYFKEYEGEVPQQFEITGFPSSSLFDL